jgi:flavorubredoxin
MNAPWNIFENATDGLPRLVAADTWWFGWCLVVRDGDKYLHNSNNCFLMIGREKTVLIDTTMPMGWPELKRDLARILNGRPLDYIFATHPESPHMGNLEPLCHEYPDVRIIGDLRNYHLFLPHLARHFLPMKPEESIDLGGRKLVLKPAVIHDLPNSLWGYDPDIQMLFVADSFPYTHDHECGQCGMTSEELPSPIRPEDTSVVISRALNWARYVDATPLIEKLRAFLVENPVKLIGPSHGGVITNPAELTDIFEAGLKRAKGLG